MKTASELLEGPIAIRGTPRPDRPHRFENGGDAGRVVSRSGRVRHGVVVGHQHHRRGRRVTTGQDADQIGHAVAGGRGILALAVQTLDRGG